MLEAATTGPGGLRTVVLVDPASPLYVPPVFDYPATLVASPVPRGYNAERVARIVFGGGRTCYWHGKRDNSNCSGRWGDANAGMLVPCGGMTFVFPTCEICRWDFGKDVTPDGWKRGYVEEDGRLDYVVDVAWYHGVGWPSGESWEWELA